LLKQYRALHDLRDDKIADKFVTQGTSVFRNRGKQDKLSTFKLPTETTSINQSINIRLILAAVWHLLSTNAAKRGDIEHIRMSVCLSVCLFVCMYFVHNN